MQGDSSHLTSFHPRQDRRVRFRRSQQGCCARTRTSIEKLAGILLPTDHFKSLHSIPFYFPSSSPSCTVLLTPSTKASTACPPPNGILPPRILPPFSTFSPNASPIIGSPPSRSATDLLLLREGEGFDGGFGRRRGGVGVRARGGIVVDGVRRSGRVVKGLELRKFWTRADGSWGLWLEKKKVLAYLGSGSFSWGFGAGACIVEATLEATLFLTVWKARAQPLLVDTLVTPR
ncbi:hypothetical protein KC357_g194 [Hortaea werneckii]|nr:hypothetical protein KC357_g194 [Hortaea werneckii]